MDTESLREFVAIVDAGNFSKASKVLYVSQPTLSKHITALEKELGLHLLVRDATKTVLTPAGEGFLPHARDIVNANDQALGWVESFKKSKPVTLSIESFSGFKVTDDFVSLIKLKLPQIHPNIIFQISDIAGGDPLEDVRLMRCDLGFLAYAEGSDMDGLASFPVVTEPLAAIVNRSNPLAQRNSIELADLDGDTVFWASEGANHYFDLIRDVFDGAGIHVIKKTIPWVNSHEWRQRTAGDAQGITIDFLSTARHDLPLTLCKVLEITDSPLVTMSAVWRAENDNPALEAALRIVHDATKELDISAYK